MLRQWLMFIALAVFWGASYFWQKLALRELGPFTVVGYRFLIGFVTSLIMMRVMGQRFPSDRRTWLGLAALSVVYSSLPVFLGAWAGARIDTNVNAVLNATSPLFALLFAVFLFRDERMTPPKVIGALLGFAGMIVIIGLDFLGAARSSDLLGQLAALATSILYGFSPGFARRMLKQMHPIVQSAALTLIADATIWSIAPFFEGVQLPALPLTWVSLLWLGAFSSSGANLLYFTLLKAWGASRASLVSYVVPLVGITLGWLLLGEQLEPRVLAGGGLVLAGLAVVARGK